MQVCRLDKKQWESFSENAHRIAFDRYKDPSLERIDFALLMVDEVSDRPVGYMTCREHDAETVYWQFGGAMPETKGTIHSFRAYEGFVKYASSHYKRVTTLIENTNTPMLKMAMKVGFRIIGVRTYQGSVLLEHLLEFTEGDVK